MEYGYLVTQKQEYVIQSYLDLRKNSINGFQEYYSEYREVFDISLVERYRGISRLPLSPIPIKQKDQYTNNLELEAQNLMDKYINEYCIKYNDDDIDMLIEKSHFINVMNKINNKNRYDPIRVSKSNFNKSEKFIGFDIGYWGGDNFSIISDSMLLPMWHGAPQNAWITLIPYKNILNKSSLFETYSDAQEFRSFYLLQDWSEEEMYEGEICIQLVEEI